MSFFLQIFCKQIFLQTNVSCELWRRKTRATSEALQSSTWHRKTFRTAAKQRGSQTVVCAVVVFAVSLLAVAGVRSTTGLTKSSTNRFGNRLQLESERKPLLSEVQARRWSGRRSWKTRPDKEIFKENSNIWSFTRLGGTCTIESRARLK